VAEAPTVSGTSRLGVLVLALLLLSGPRPASASADTCVLSLTLAPAELDVWVREDDPVNATFEGSFAVTAAPSMASEIRFTATASTGWTVTMNPASMVLEEAEQSNGTFNVSVVVPHGAPSTGTGLVSVEGRANAGDVACGEASAQARVTPLPYFEPVRIKVSPQPADVDPVTGAATVDLTLTAATNAPGPALARLNVRTSAGVAHDAPQDIALSPSGSDSVQGLVTVHFFPPDGTPRTYTVTVFADVLGTREPGGIRMFFSTTIQVRVLPQPMNGAVVAFTVVGAIVTLGAALWVWQATRPDRR